MTLFGFKDNKSRQDIYPVGSIYMNVNNVNPTTLFGGTWEPIQGRFLLACDSDHAAGSSGGEESHTLTTSEMPSHTHVQNSHNHTQNQHRHHADTPTNWNNSYFIVGDECTVKQVPTASSGEAYQAPVNNAETYHGFTNKGNTAYETATNNATTAVNQSTGGGAAHNNMPPYLAVYVWKRTA